MQTSPPNLPFTNYGQAVLPPGSTHSKTSQQKHPRTDLTNLRHWATFPNDVHQLIQSATNRAQLSPAPFDVGGASSAFVRNVKSEQKIHAHATVELHERVEKVVHKLGVVGSFDEAGVEDVAIIGDPDFSWVMGDAQPRPKLIVEYTAWWVADLVDLPAAFAGTRTDLLSRQSLESLQQIYGYMTFNNKFGILTNWQRTWFLRRSETDNCKTLDYFLVELAGPNPPMSMLKAWVGMVLLAEDDWFYASPTPSIPPQSRYFGDTRSAWRSRRPAIDVAEGYQSRPVNGEYSCLTLDHSLCISNLSSARRGANGCIVEAEFLQPLGAPEHGLPVICKVVDVLS